MLLPLLLLLFSGSASTPQATKCPSVATVDSTATADRLLTAGELARAGRSNVWDALSLLDPSILLSDRALQGGRTLYVPQAMSVGDVSRWATGSRQPHALVMVDGQRADVATLRQLGLADIDHIRVVHDPLRLASYGLNGADGVVEVVTRKHTLGDIQVSYLLDTGLDFANRQTYGKAARGSSATDWLRLPLQTGFRHRHQVNVSGGDRYVGYLFSATLQPESRGVMVGSKEGISKLRSFVSYAHKQLRLQNDIAFSQSFDRQSPYGAFADLARIAPSTSPYDASGALTPTIAVDNRQVPNPVYEASLGSFDKSKYTSLTDRFGLRLDLNRHFMLQGDFNYLRTMARRDIFLSPNSAHFAANADMRARGTYHILRDNHTRYEGGASLSYRQSNAVGQLHASTGVRFFDGKATGETYGGRGILSDRMSYVSFTQAYDTLRSPSASRAFERTLQGFVALDYLFRHKYRLTLITNVNHSSLLPSRHRDAAYYGAAFHWDVAREGWMRGSIFDRLALRFSMGTTGVVPFTDRYFSASYRNDIHNEYIYNYYQIGARLQGMPNEDLKPTRLSSCQMTVDMAIRDFLVRLDLFHKRTSDLLVYARLPYYEGFSHQPDNGGTLSNTGYLLSLSKSLGRTDNLQATLRFASSLYINKVKALPDYFKTNFYTPALSALLDRHVFANSLGLDSRLGRYTCALTLHGLMTDKTPDHTAAEGTVRRIGWLDLRTLQVGYDLGAVKHWFHKADLTVTAENLLSWRSRRLPAGIHYPEVRSVVASVHVVF